MVRPVTRIISEWSHSLKRKKYMHRRSICKSSFIVTMFIGLCELRVNSQSAGIWTVYQDEYEQQEGKKYFQSLLKMHNK